MCRASVGRRFREDKAVRSIVRSTYKTRIGIMQYYAMFKAPGLCVTSRRAWALGLMRNSCAFLFQSTANNYIVITFCSQFRLARNWRIWRTATNFEGYHTIVCGRGSSSSVSLRVDRVVQVLPCVDRCAIEYTYGPGGLKVSVYTGGGGGGGGEAYLLCGP